MSNSITSSFSEQYRRMIEEAADSWCRLALQNVPLDEKGFQNLMSRADEFKAVIERAIVNETKDFSAEYHQSDDEEVTPLFDHYFNHYQPRPISEQIELLQKMIPGLGAADLALAEEPLPEGAEGYFAIPRWESIAPTYEEAVEKMFELLHDNLRWDVCEEGREGRLFNFRTGRVGPKYLRAYEKSAAMWKRVCDSQEGYDILIVPAQFGLKYAGKSANRARELMADDEFGLNTFAVGAMLLTHPGRMIEFDDLWMECPGDEYSLNGDGNFELIPLYFFGNGELEFDVIKDERFRIGSVSGFLPKGLA